MDPRFADTNTTNTTNTTSPSTTTAAPAPAPQAQAAQARRIVESMPGFAWSANAAGVFTYVSPNALAYLGEAETKLNADVKDEFGWRAFVHPADYVRVADRWQHCLKTGDHYDTEHRLRRADGVYRWFRNSGRPLRDKQGRITEWYGTTMDIEDQKRAEAAVLERERELGELVDLVPSHIWRLTPSGEPAFFNKRMVDFIGLDVSDTDRPGMTRLEAMIKTSVHPEDAEMFSHALHDCLESGEQFALRYRLRRADGVYHWMSSRASALRDQEGRIVQWFGICHDIDDQVHTEEALRQSERLYRMAQEDLARASQAASLAELSASIAHEVNQPLAAIVANSHACQRWLKSDPPNLGRAETTVERIIRDANAAADVVSRIRALFRHSVNARSSTSLQSIIAEARELMNDDATRRGVRIDIDIEHKLPLVSLDYVQIQQVLINLIRNGMESMEQSRGERVLVIRARQTDDAVETAVSDHGSGIEFPDRIFEPFFTTKRHGMGMGLPICRSIVESHNGRLWLEKNDPVGSRFIFTLPVEAPAVQ